MAEFAIPLTERDRSWCDLRERLAQAAREMHFYAFSSGAVNSEALLVISGNLAGLAMSIPLGPTNIGSAGLVDSSTLLATQILQLDRSWPRNTGTADAD
jgi:hypothetical protein